MSWCKLCASLVVTPKLKYNDALAKEHARIHHGQLSIFDKEITLDRIVETCFPTDGCLQSGTHRDSLSLSRSSKLKRSALGAKRHLLCRHLVKTSGDQNGNIQCRLCVKSFKATIQVVCQSRNLLDHAFRHLQKPTARCKVCAKAFWNHWILEPHLRKVHGLPLANNYENLEDQFHDDIIAVLRKCYSDNADDGASEETRSKSIKREVNTECTTARGSPLTIERRMVCYGLCRKFIDRDGKMKCKVYGMRIKAKDAKGRMKSVCILHHALTHLTQRALNRCKICSLTFLTKCNINQHLRITHALPLANNYECLTDQFHPEILAILQKCFGDETNDEDSSGGTSESRRIRNQVKGSKLAIERQSLCVQLIKKYLDRDGKMPCRMCSKRITATKASGCYKTVEVTYHALTHMRLHLHRCKLCCKSFFTRQRVISHLNKNHGTSGDASKYECLEDQYHSEIVDMFRKCYGDETGPTK